MKEFFGFGGYTRDPEGFMSWQHIVFVTSLVLVMIGLAVYFGIRNRGADPKTKNKALVIAAILIDSIEIFKIIIMCVRGADSAYHHSSRGVFPWKNKGGGSGFRFYLRAFRRASRNLRRGK